MSIALTNRGNQPIIIEDKPLSDGVGGEGAVHRIISPSWYEGGCVKIYDKKYRTKNRERKLDFMLKQPMPNMDSLQKGGCIIGWPTDLVYQQNSFVGFAMPLAFSGSCQLYQLCTSEMKKLSSVWKNKYDRESVKGVESRLKLCVNIASAVNYVHNAGKYVFVDLKPQNILVTNDGKVSVIDLDSIQIAENNRVLFPSQVATPEYVPVEGNHLNPTINLIPESWDRFSLAVVFYQLLFGLHPYAASFQGQYQNSTSLPDKIKDGLFVFGSKQKYVHVRPQPHDNFSRIPASLQTLFVKAFDTGHNNPVLRPTAEEWGRTIFKEIDSSGYRLKGFSNPVRVKPPLKPAAAKISYERIRPNPPQTHPTATRLWSPPAAPTMNQPIATTTKKRQGVGKAVRWTIALVVLFFVLPPIIGSFINYMKKNTRSRSSSYSTSPTYSACQRGGTGYLTTNVKLRRNPTTDHKQLAIHYRGARVQILEIMQGEYSRGNNYWYRVRVLSKGCHAERPNVCGSEGSAMEGWVHNQLVACS